MRQSRAPLRSRWPNPTLPVELAIVNHLVGGVGDGQKLVQL